jgi:peptidoglycan-N-acetylglucosamine deacetylase
MSVAAASGVAALGAAAVMAYGVRAPRSGMFAPSVWRGPEEGRRIAITFDDGPTPSTPKLLEVLERFGVKASFFVCGVQVERRPGVLRDLVAAGHEVGNHTQTHRMLAFQSAGAMRQEIGKAQRSIFDTCGVKPRWFRAPYGVRWPGLGAVQDEFSLMGVMWSVIGRDWVLDAGGIARRILRAARAGSIVCLHDGRELATNPNITSTIEATRAILPRLQESGYRIVTLTELLCPTTSCSESSG